MTNPSNETNETIVTIKRAAELVQLSENSVYKHLKQGKLSRSHLGKGIEMVELIRCYGNLKLPAAGAQHEGVSKPVKGVKVTVDNPVSLTESNVQSEQVIELLKEQLADMKLRMNESVDRENRLLSILESKLLEDHSAAGAKQGSEGIVSKIRKLW